jgi:hypothetical protein
VQTTRIAAPLTRWYAPLLDLACLVAFVAGGRENHGYDTGVSWFFEILWPFVVAFAIGAAVTQLYRRTDRLGVRLGTTIAITMVVALSLRSIVYGRTLITTFAIVATLFITATTFGWRIVALILTRRRQLSRVNP